MVDEEPGGAAEGGTGLLFSLLYNVDNLP